MTLFETASRPSLFADGLAAHGDGVAVIAGDRTCTYRELDEAVGNVADRLGGTRRLVLVEAANTLPALTAYLGALRAGHPVMLAPSSHPGAARQLRSTYDPDVVVTEEDGWALRQCRPGSAHDLHPELALLLSTSGTTGSPKLVRLSRRNLQANAAAIASYLGITAGDRAVTTLPMQYCYGLSVIHSHLHVGAGLVLTDRSVVQPCFWDLVRRHGVTSFAGVPHTFDLLDRVGFDTMELPTLRTVTQAGGRLPPERVRRYAALGARSGWDFVVMYGQTEATARMAYLPPELAAEHPTSIGVPIPGGTLTVEGPDGNGVGELVYRGDNVMLGYAEGPGDLRRGRTVTELRTGDLGRVTPAGLFEVVGRQSRFIKPFGVRVDLDRVERLLADRGITAVATGDDERLVVAVEGGTGADQVTPVLVEHLGLPRSSVGTVAVAEVPRLATGKPDYAAIAAAAGTRRGPAPDAVDAVRGAFAEVLGVEPTADDTFVGLGGDSLSYVEMATRLEGVLGDLPPDWHSRTVVDLAAVARRRRRSTRADPSVVVRAVAIVAVVAHHTGLVPFMGGAHVLLAVAGYNFGRFKRDSGAMVASAARLAVPSVLWITVLAIVSDDWGWPNAVLLNGWLGPERDFWGYWYLEAIIQIVLVLAALFTVPALRALDRRAPFAVALGAVAVGLAVRFDVPVEFTTVRTWARPHEIFWLFALGWAGAHASTLGRRLVVTATMGWAMYGFFIPAEQDRALIVLAGAVAVLWLPFVPLPRAAGRVVAVVSAASLYTYLTHFQVYKPLLRAFGPLAATAGSLVVGVAVWFVARRVTPAAEHALRRVWRLRARPHTAGAADVVDPVPRRSAEVTAVGRPA